MLHIKINEVDSGLEPLFFTMFLIILSICTKAAMKIIIIYTNNSWRDRTYIPLVRWLKEKIVTRWTKAPNLAWRYLS